jgi:hypothetical protein
MEFLSFKKKKKKKKRGEEFLGATSLSTERTPCRSSI